MYVKILLKFHVEFSTQMDFQYLFFIFHPHLNFIRIFTYKCEYFKLNFHIKISVEFSTQLDFQYLFFSSTFKFYWDFYIHM